MVRSIFVYSKRRVSEVAAAVEKDAALERVLSGSGLDSTKDSFACAQYGFVGIASVRQVSLSY